LISVRRLDEADLAVLQPLFSTVFKSSISLDLLRWKYADGHGESWTAWEGDQLALHCGVCFRDVLAAGQSVRAAQLVDLMASPKTTGLSRAHSPFVELMHALLKSLPGPENPDGIAFGFPSDRAMRLGEHLGVYRAVGRIASLSFAPRKDSRVRYRVITRLDERLRSSINTLWERMAADFHAAVIGVRDAAAIERRYLAYPEKRYVLLLVENGWLRRPLGLAMIRPDVSRPELLDIVGPREAMPTVLAAARAWLSATGGTELTWLLAEPFATALAGCAENCHPTEFRIMANPFSPLATNAGLENRWWLTGGDTDYR
jgi:hypothetical protein